MYRLRAVAYNISISGIKKQGIHLEPGATAPEFEAADTFGDTVRLSDYKNKHVLLVFLRYSACPWCNMTIHRLSVEYPMLQENDCEVIAFMQSKPANIQKNIYDMHRVRPGFPIIPDIDLKYYKQYGVKTSLPAAAVSIKDIPYWLKSISVHGLKRPEIDGNLLLVPATFLVSPGAQSIVKAEYGSSFYDNQTFTKIYEPLIFQ